MNQMMQIGNREIQVKEYNGQRVVTFKDIDLVHERPETTARQNFNRNKKHFIEGVDFYLVKPSDVLKYVKHTLEFEIPNRGLIIITESGYLMLVKSFTDDLAWAVQRQLVNSYFKVRDEIHLEVNENVLSHKEKIKVMEILSNCSQFNLPYVLDLAKPFLSQEVIDFYMQSKSDVEPTPTMTVRMQLPSDFNQKLLTALADNNMTQSGLAKKINCAKSTVSHYVNGKSRPDETMIQRIAETLNINFYN